MVSGKQESWSSHSIKPQKQPGRRLLGEQLELFFLKTQESPTVTSADLLCRKLFIPLLISEKLSWGNQEPIWPISNSALRATPSSRIQYLARHKRDFSAREDPQRKQEEDEEEAASFFRKTRHPSSETSQYENTMRLSVPKRRSLCPLELGSLHTPQCERNSPIWHVDPRVRNFILTARLLQLSQPKRIHPDYRGNRESAASIVSFASRTAQMSQRLAQLSLPKLKRSDICRQLGRFDEPIWTVSGAAKKASASVHVEKLAASKQLHKDYIPPKEPMWSRKNSKTS